MTIIAVLLGAWLVWRYFRRRPAAPVAVFAQRRQWGLMLAKPMVDATDMSGFFDPRCDSFQDNTKVFFRAPLLHQVALRSNATDEEVREHLDASLERQWFRFDLHGLSPTDDPRAAMAFACVRTAFFVRCAMLMKWIEPMTAWRVLLLNAQRAQDCFDGWEDFGQAFIVGRRQWVAAFRADSLGAVFNDASLGQLLMPNSGAWAGMPWRELPALHPTAMA